MCRYGRVEATATYVPIWALDQPSDYVPFCDEAPGDGLCNGPSPGAVSLLDRLVAGTPLMSGSVDS